MKRFGPILPAMLLVAASICCGQITINQSGVPGTGTTIQSSDAIELGNIGGSGGNQTWNFSSLTYDSPVPAPIVDPGSTPFAATFPTATHCFVNEDGGFASYTYLRSSANGLYLQGSATVMDTNQVVFVYTPEALWLPFPLTYQTNWTTVTHITYEPIPGYFISIIDSTLNTCDAWGNLITPQGTQPSLRVRMHGYSATTVPGMPTEWTEDYSYGWFTQNALTGADISSDDDPPNPNFTEGYLSISWIGNVEADPVRGPLRKEFSLGANYPNPFNPETSLPITLERTGTVEFKVYDELGRLVMNESHVLSSGSHNLAVDGSSWASGNYIAQVTLDGMTKSHRMVLMK